MDPLIVEGELYEYFADRGDVAAVYLFGSVARGDADAEDVDVAVLFRDEPPPTLEGLGLDIASDLERRLEARVDLLVLNRAPVDVVRRVLCDGRLVVDRAPPLRVRFEVHARNAYFDLEPILREYRRTGDGRAR